MVFVTSKHTHLIYDLAINNLAHTILRAIFSIFAREKGRKKEHFARKNNKN